MAFPWELNLECPYRDEKWPFHEELARRDSTDSDSAAPLRNSMDFRQIVRLGNGHRRRL